MRKLLLVAVAALSVGLAAPMDNAAAAEKLPIVATEGGLNISAVNIPLVDRQSEDGFDGVTLQNDLNTVYIILGPRTIGQAILEEAEVFYQENRSSSMKDGAEVTLESATYIFAGTLESGQKVYGRHLRFLGYFEDIGADAFFYAWYGFTALGEEEDQLLTFYWESRGDIRVALPAFLKTVSYVPPITTSAVPEGPTELSTITRSSSP